MPEAKTGAKDSTAGAKPRRRSYPKAIGQTVKRFTRSVFGRRGLADGAIVRDWRAIAGAALAAHSQPERIIYPTAKQSGGTLHLRVDSGALATEIQHQEPLLVERINTYFGFKAISRLKLIQAPIGRNRESKQPATAPLDGTQESILRRQLENVGNADLKAALDGLGRAVMGRRGAPKSGPRE